MPRVERPPHRYVTQAEAGELSLLRHGAIEVLGILPYSSNYTYLARVGVDGHEVLAVYKPRRGERPLWDFEHGTLAAREVAAYVASEAAGFDIVPATVLRDDAPGGGGSLQLFVDHDPERHYFTLVEQRRDDFATFAAFDVVINNADRKAGHVLEDRRGRLWAVDHGVSFHVDYKLRTVIWEFAEQPLPEPIVAALHRVLEHPRLYEDLSDLLSVDEATATRRRVEELLHEGVFPAPRGVHPLPWPLV